MMDSQSIVDAALRLAVKRLWKRDVSIGELRKKAWLADRWFWRSANRIGAEPVAANGVPSEWIGDEGSARRGVLLYLHGGAFCLHLPNSYRYLAWCLAERTGLRVLLPSYRLAPEHRFPCGLDDCVSAYRWLVEQGTPIERLAVAGDSAGGNLALAMLMRLRDDQVPLPACAAVMSPVTDLTGASPSVQTNEDSDVLFSRPALALVRATYLDTVPAADVHASPVSGTWDGLPPMLFHVSGSEMLLDDSLRAVAMARTSGVDAQVKVWPGMPHVFQMIGLLPQARQSLDEIANFLIERCGLEPPGVAHLQGGLRASAA